MPCSDEFLEDATLTKAFSSGNVPAHLPTPEHLLKEGRKRLPFLKPELRVHSGSPPNSGKHKLGIKKEGRYRDKHLVNGSSFKS